MYSQPTTIILLFLLSFLVRSATKYIFISNLFKCPIPISRNIFIFIYFHFNARLTSVIYQKKNKTSSSMTMGWSLITWYRYNKNNLMGNDSLISASKYYMYLGETDTNKRTDLKPFPARPVYIRFQACFWSIAMLLILIRLFLVYA